jgi:hypothetical protein
MPTVEDTRIDEIGDIILNHRYKKDPRDMNALKYSSYLMAKKILEYMAPTIEKAEKYDDLCLIKDPIQVEREYFQELVEKAEKWDRLKSLFETSCDKCFLNHICGTRGNPGAVCEDIKEAIEGEKI